MHCAWVTVTGWHSMMKIGTLAKRPIFKQFVVVKSHHARSIRMQGCQTFSRANKARHGIDGESSDEESNEENSNEESDEGDE